MIGSKSESFQGKLLDHISHIWNEKEETTKFEKSYLFLIIGFLVVIFLLLVVTDIIKLLWYWAMVEYVAKIWTEMNKMEKKEGKEESPIPMLILLAIIILGGISLVVFLVFGE